MAAISTIKLGGLGYMLADSLETLPDIVFRGEVTDIATAVNALGDAIELRAFQSNMEKSAMVKDTAGQVFRAYEDLKENPEFASCFSSLNQLAGRMGETLVSIFNMLRTGVKPEVESLRQSIQDRMTDILRAKNYDVLISTDEKPSTDFEILDWDATMNKVGGTEVILNAASEYMRSNAGLSINDIRLLLDMNILDTKNIQVNAETEADIISRVMERAGSDRRNEVSSFFQMLTSAYQFQSLLHSSLGSSIGTNEYQAVLCNCISQLEGLYPIYEAFRKTPLDVSDDLLAEIQDNLSVFEKFFFVVAYLMLILRKSYSGMPVIDFKRLNGDAMEEFDSAGGTKEDVAYYLAAFYTSKKRIIPYNGISISEILSGKDSAKSEYDRQAQSQLMQASTIRHTVMAEAMSTVLGAYIQAADPSRLPADMSITMFTKLKMPLVQTAIHRLDISEDHHLDNILYDFVLTVWYDGTMVKTAHELFGAEIVRQMEASSELSSESLALVDAHVASAICATFLMNEICKAQ